MKAELSDSQISDSISQTLVRSIVCIALCLGSLAVAAQENAPGAPGKDAQWATAAKQGIGTSASLESKVWFTLAEGVMTEVYYPDVTAANVHLLQFIVVDPRTKRVETERDDAIHKIRVMRPDSLTFQQINTAKSGEWAITKTYATDPQRDSVLISVRFTPKRAGLSLYVYYDPSIANTGMKDGATSPAPRIVMGADEGPARAESMSPTKDFGLNSFEGDVNSALMFSSPISEMSNGFAGVSDGLEQLRKYGKIMTPYWRAENGNVAQIAKINTPGQFTAVLAFSTEKDVFGTAFVNARESLAKGFAMALAEYEQGWSKYVGTIPKVGPKYQAQFNMAAMVLKAQEDKTVRGANVASLTIPWGGGANANEDVGGGYHLVWARDLYHVFTAYLALGDKAAAGRALDFLFNVQQKEDGSFPQNSWLDGKRGWGSLQLDEVGYPLVMAWQLGRFDKATYENHVKRAADFLVRNGPKTPQERWEEEGGFSPSTIAAEIAGLVCAADIAKRNGDEASSLIYLAAADDWARNIERWTATTTGKIGDGNYYLRITQNGNPDTGDKIELNNGAGTFDEREIVDAGFLELVRLGIKPANDPLIAKSVKVIDRQIKVATPNGDSFYRYSRDGYGEMDDGRRWNWDGKYTGKGRLWALLAGERGEYEIAVCGTRSAELGSGASTANASSSNCLMSVRARLDAMLGFANDGRMIPEQVWDKAETPKNYDHEWVPVLKFGEGTGSATPLAWSMAQFIRLATNLHAGRNLETPQIVYDRYVKGGIPTQVSNFGGLDSEAVLPMKPGETVRFPRQATPGSKLAYQIGGRSGIVRADEKGRLTIEFKVPSEPAVGIVGVESESGATAFERVLLRPTPGKQTFSPGLVEKIRTASKGPFADNGKAVFLYRGPAQNVQLAGDVTGWNPGRIFLQEISDGLWAVQLDLAPAARTEYKLIVDGRWVLDPLNPETIDNGVGDRNSVFAMPAYQPYKPTGSGEPKLEEFEITSKKFGVRTIKVYLPKAYKNGTERFPAAYLEDGSEYVRRASAPQVLEDLVTRGKVKPFILVLLDPKDRTKEYSADDGWAEFVATEVVPEVDKRYRTIKDRDARATLGASLGGITSLWIGLKYPGEFARLGGQSSSFWVDDQRVVRELVKLDPAGLPFRFYLDDGVLEGAEDTRSVNVMLRGKGYPVVYVEGSTGHNWTAWRDRLADAFVALWE